MEENFEMVAVATTSQPMEATMIQVKLASHGIDSQLFSELTIGLNPLLSNAIGGVRVFVSAQDFAQASEILAERAQEKAQKEAVLARTCPACGNENGQKRRVSVWGGILMVLTLGIYSLLFMNPCYVCPNCRHKW